MAHSPVAPTSCLPKRCSRAKPSFMSCCLLRVMSSSRSRCCPPVRDGASVSKRVLSVPAFSHLRDRRPLSRSRLDIRVRLVCHAAMGLAVLRARFSTPKCSRWPCGTRGHDRNRRYGLRRSHVARPRPHERVVSLARRAPRTAPPSASPAREGERKLRAMLFGDVKGFSKLTEAQIPAFVTEVLGALGNVLAKYGEAAIPQYLGRRTFRGDR